MVRLYNKLNQKWHRNVFIALFGYLRDLIVQILPFNLPLFMVVFLYRLRPDFIFLVHPRQSEDIYRALPFLTALRKILKKNTILKFFKYCPPCVIGAIKTQRGVNGLIVSSFYLPDLLLGKNKRTLKEARRCIRFARKISKKNSYIGLGAWWPVVTRRGLAMAQYAKKKKMRITNGHTGTLISLVSTIKKISKLADIDAKDLKILLIGTGKMGSNLGKILASEIKTIGLVDINPKRIERLEGELQRKNKNILIKKFANNELIDIREILDSFHLSVCVTSNARRILKTEDIPNNFIIIDDSRPEAVSRQGLGEGRIVLEGGLIKIPGLTRTYNYGFGIDENVFGCLAETYALALDDQNFLKPTLGDVDFVNYDNMLNFFKREELEAGDFKTGDIYVSNLILGMIMRKRVEQLS